MFKALQTYADCDVVRWIEEPPAGGEEPEHPAPTLKLTMAAAAGGNGPVANANANLVGSTTATDDDGAGWALTLGIAGLVAGLVGLVLCLLAWRRTTPAG